MTLWGDEPGIVTLSFMEDDVEALEQAVKVALPDVAVVRLDLALLVEELVTDGDLMETKGQAEAWASALEAVAARLREAR